LKEKKDPIAKSYKKKY